jgi:hypothetical protein
MPKVIKSIDPTTLRQITKRKYRVKNIGKKHTRKNHKRIVRQKGASNKKREDSDSDSLKNKIREEILESTQINIREHLTKPEINEIYKEDGDIARKIHELEIFLKKDNKATNVKKILSKLKFNKYRVNSMTGKRDKNVKEQAIDIIKNNKIQDIEDIMTSKLTKKNIDNLLKEGDDKLKEFVKCNESDLRKSLEGMKFNPTLMNNNTGKPFISLLQQAHYIIDNEGKTESDILDLIKNNLKDNIYSSTNVNKKLR